MFCISLKGVPLNFSAKVFPGGNFDTGQDDSFEMTAIRETFEETGLLLATSGQHNNLDDAQLDTTRKAIHSQKISFRSFLLRHHLSPNVSNLLPFTQWVTPPFAPR